MFFIKNRLINKIRIYKDKIVEYIKFNIVGTINFLLSQLFYLILYILFNVNYIVAYTITSVISISASYYFNSRYTFRDNHYSLKKYTFTFLVYIFEYIFNLGVILILVNIFNLNKAFAPIITPVFSTIPTFLLMRLVVKHVK